MPWFGHSSILYFQLSNNEPAFIINNDSTLTYEPQIKQYN